MKDLKRKAIIIGSPLDKGHKDYLPGVKLDVKNYYNFLRSQEAGQWSVEDEIVILENPIWGELNNYLKLCDEETDICYVVFSGHGHVKMWDTFLQLNAHEQPIKHTSLYTASKRQITIIDTCRYPIKVTHNIFEGFSGIGSPPTGLHYSNTNFFFRTYYNEVIQKMPLGKIDIFSASLKQFSSDIYNVGGWFSYNFLRIAEQLSQQKNVIGTCFSVNYIFRETHYFMINNMFNRNVQIPEIVYNKPKKIPFVLHYNNTEKIRRLTNIQKLKLIYQNKK